MNESSQTIYINESGIVVLEIEKDKRIPMMIDTLSDIWKSSVRASHHFLTEDDIIHLTPQAEDALRGIETLWVMEDRQRPVGFMGMQNRKIEMLFLHPDCFRKGLGKVFIRLAFDKLDIEFVNVNEQNPNARRFYEHMGVKVFKRNEFDDAGNPFPILEMKRH